REWDRFPNFCRAARGDRITSATGRKNAAESGGIAVRIGPRYRKRRTRQHVIADLSVNHVERFVLRAGHTVQRLTPDYGYDLILFTYDEQGYAEPGMAFMQVKAAETLKRSGTDCVFDLDVRDYHRWMFERYPVMLILFDALRGRACWLVTVP